VRYLLQSLGVQGRIKSPSYAIVESYELPPLSVWHFGMLLFVTKAPNQTAGFLKKVILINEILMQINLINLHSCRISER
jgi:tRNA A37 threonylcarbamoyladenosine biosynthesis protein TsaE